MADMEKREEGEEEYMSVLDFDMLCSAVALQAEGKWRNPEAEAEADNAEFGGVFRMWEGELLSCFQHPRIALQSLCCPCYRFGKNMGRAGFGSCFVQGTVYFILMVVAFLSSIAFIVTRRHCFLYLAVASTISLGTYLGFLRTQIKKKFNIRGSDSSMDDCIFHLICPCCTLCQESRTLEMNNVQDGTWHGRGDTICIGSYGEGSKSFFELRPPPLISTMSASEKTTDVSEHAPLVPSSQ